MSPPTDNVPSTPESRSGGSGLASVLKGLSSRHRTPTSTSSPSTTSLAPPVPHGGSLGRRSSRSTFVPAVQPAPEPEPFVQSTYIQRHISQLRPDQPLSERVAGAEALRHSLVDCAPGSIVEIWTISKDLIKPSNPSNARVAGFDLLEACLKQSSHKPLERRQFFETLSEPCHADDFHLQLSLMRDLTGKGKNVSSFETSIGSLLISWLKTSYRSSILARKSSKSSATTGEETNLENLFALILDTIRYSYKAFKEEDVRALLEECVVICGKTTSEADIRNCINVMDAVIIYGYFPSVMLSSCTQTLCRTYSTLKNLSDMSWKAMSNLCRSHVSSTTLSALFAILRKPELDAGNTNTMRGAIAIIEKLLIKKGTEGLVKVSLPTLMDSLRKALAADSARLENELVRVVHTILKDPELANSALEDDCTNMLRVLHKATQRADLLMDVPEPVSHGERKERDLGNSLSQTLNDVFALLEQLFPRFEIIQKERIMNFFFGVHERLSDSCAQLLIVYYIDEQFCYPSNPSWLDNSKQLISYFLKNRSRQASVRLQVLRAMRDVYETIKDVAEPLHVNSLVWAILDDMRVEREAQVLEMLVNFAVEVCDEADNTLFDKIFASLQQCLPFETPSPYTGSGSNGSRPGSTATQTSGTSSLDSVATRAVVHIFMRAFNESAHKASCAFDTILKIAQSELCATDARLSAMKLLFRLRCDSNSALIIVSQLDSDGLAAALNRTPETLSIAREIIEEVPPSRHSRLDDNASIRSSRSTSMGQPQSFMSRSTTRSLSAWGGPVRPPMKPVAPLWMYPDENALPQDAPPGTSRLLYAIETLPPELDISLNGFDLPRTVLSINIWLEAIISILQQGGDWEIYSHVLVHLGSQLTNHALFQGAIPQIKLLRNVLCDQLRSGSFHEPPSSSGLRKADVEVCLFHNLTMVISYCRHFAQIEQDEIVKTIVPGLGGRTGKRCLHALTICCHELSGSVTKSMGSIMEKLSKLITQSQQAAHVLEFLAGLARLPKVYVNFRSDDYQTLFGICFRYLQYAREQKLKGSGSAPGSVRASYASNRQSGVAREHGSNTENRSHPATADDLPQYVYALVYHVIIFWFMSMRISDRWKHVSSITKNLISVDANGREHIDEPSQVTIDMMQRVAFSDFDETVHNPQFASPLDGEVRKKTWLDGLSIVTVETAASSGLSQITKRQPSGTSHSIFRFERAPLPAHQIASPSDTYLSFEDESTRIAVLPSHVFLQLSSTSFRVPEAMRPIPLPDDPATERAIASFDRTSVVDGHKIGIIYVGENQTTEQEIFGNVMGSNDYTEFLQRMGTLTRLKGARFNTQGLDREYDTDGQFTYCWRDRVTEIVFHITTMMPTDPVRDPTGTNKKRHTGNDFVNIIFNNSGGPFRFDTFPSQYNYVNIVVTPESRASFVATRTTAQRSNQHPTDHDSSSNSFPYYKVQVMSKPGFPEISPAAETKIISAESLPAFVRLLALNASVFSLVWSNRGEGNEHISSWRNRLRLITSLRDRYQGIIGSTGASTPTNSLHGGITNPGGVTAGGMNGPSGGGIGSGSSSMTALGHGGGGGSSSTNSSGVPGPLSLLGVGGSRDSRDSTGSSSLRRSSAATFTSESHASHRSSVLSNNTATETDITFPSGESEGVVDGFDFSKWS